jgi:DNA-binding transcriptional MerR regulator
MAKQGTSVKRAAELLGISPRWIRARIADGAISPKRANGRRGGPYVLSDTDVEALRGIAAEATAQADGTALARIGQLEAERANLLARLAWEHATAEARQQAIEEEKHRVEQLTAELAAQRGRVEQLKALSLVDRVLGRHKAI